MAEGGLSRRRLMGIAAGTGVAAWAAPYRLAGAQTPAGESPKYGGVLTQDTFADPPHFDLHQSETITALLPLAPCYSRLIQPDPFDVDKLIPDLAERWDISKDGKVYTFHLRRGVKFHHGKPLAAEDVKASWDRIISPPKGVFSVRKLIFEAIGGIEAPDAQTVRFVLKRPNWSLLTNMAHGWNVIFPKDILDAKGDMKRDVIGTGPFKFKQYVRGVSLEVERNSDYHVKGRPYLDGVKRFFIPDGNTAVNAYIAGQLLLHEVNLESQADQARQQLGSRGVVVKTPQMSALTMELNSGRKPWGDPRVRQAASMAIDRKEAMQVMTDGAGEVGGMMLPTGRWALPLAELRKLPGYSTDKAAERAQAKKLLAEAGFPNGLKVAMTVRRGQQFESAAILLKDHLSQVGIEANIEVLETAAYLDRMARRDFEISGGSFSTAVDDPDAILGQNYLCNAGRNYGNMCVPEVEKLFSRVAHGARISLRIGITAVLLGTTAGALIGLVSGYLGGRTDLMVQRVMDGLMAFPTLVLALAVVAAVGASVRNVIIAVGLTLAPAANRLVRSVALSVRETPFVMAARALGGSQWRVVFRHVLPNCLAPYLVIATANLGSAIVAEASLGFLGLGVPPPTPAWGSMLSGATQTYLFRAPWMAIYPGLAISLAVFGFNMLGDAVRDLLDPRLKGRG